MQRIDGSDGFDDEERRPFAVALLHAAPPTVRVQVIGEVDLATAPRLEAALRAQLDPIRSPLLELELGGLTFIDARGVAALLSVAHAVRAAGGRMRLLAPTPHIRRVLELTGVPTVCEVT